MSRKGSESYRTDSISMLTDDRLLAIWDEIQSGDLEWDEDWLSVFYKEILQRKIVLTIDIFRGQLSFDVSDEDMRFITQESIDPWVKPDCDRDDFSYILCYAQSFAGYDYAERSGFDLGDLANKHLNDYLQTGQWVGDFVTLRCCLFYEIRRQRHCGLYESTWRQIQSLFRAVCAAYASEINFPR